ncbi:MAG: dockerin type I domain-containing protein [Planctomycetota bacterium]
MFNRLFTQIKSALAAVLLAVLAQPASATTIPIEVLALSEDAAPGGGTFEGFSAVFGAGGAGPVINQAGDFAFTAQLSGAGTTGNGIFAQSAGGTRRAVVLSGDPAPFDPGLVFFGGDFQAIDESGRVTFNAVLVDDLAAPSVGFEALYTESTPGGPLIEVARLGQTTPAGSTFDRIAEFAFPDIATNSQDEIVFIGGLADPARRMGAFRFDRTGGLATVMSGGDLLNGGPDTLGSDFRGFTLGDDGAVTATNFRDVDGVVAGSTIRASASGQLVELIAPGDIDTSGTVEVITTRHAPVSNASGQAITGATVSVLANGSERDELLIKQADGRLERLIGEGDLVPGRADVVDFIVPSALRNDGTAALDFRIVEFVPNAFLGGIALYHPDTGIETIVVSGDPVPSGEGVFNSLGSGSQLNSAGQFPFGSSEFIFINNRLTAASSLFAYDPSLGIVEILKRGDEFLGSKVEDIDLGVRGTFAGPSQTTFNDLGQGVFQFSLEDGRSGLARFTIPGAELLGDLDLDGDVDADDIDLLFDNLGDPTLDLTDDGNTDQDDIDELINNILGTFPADANLDGQVTTFDLAILAANFGQTDQGWATADFNGDGQVTTFDLAILAANFGNGTPPVQAANTPLVPEPASLALLGLGALAIASRRLSR